MLLKSKLALTLGLLFSLGAQAETYHWDTVAMGGTGFVSGIIPSKSERGVVFVRTDVGGAYRYDAQAGRWIALNDSLGESNTGLMGVESIAIDPKNAANVYMLTGTEYFNNGKTAIMRSTDYGRHFDVVDVTAQFKTHGNGMGRQNGERLQVDPGSGNVLFVGTRHNGLFKSVDSGATWSHVDGLNVGETPNGNGISFVLLDPTSVTNGTAKRIFIGVSRFGSVGPNLYMSKDGGATFAPVAGAPSGLMPQRAAITSKGRLYLTYANGAGPGGTNSEPMNQGQIWEYNTVGGAWTNITPTGLTAAYGGISVDPSNPKHLVASTISTWMWQQHQPSTWGDRIFTSQDAGRTWTDVVAPGITIDPNGIPYSSQQAIHWAGSIEFDPFDPKTAWVISGNGLFKNSNVDAPGGTWKFDAHGIEEAAVFTVESIPNGPLATAIGDNDGFLNTDPAQYGTQFSPRMGTTNGLAVAAQATQVMARVGGSLYTSNNMGASWQQASSTMGTGGVLALSADGYALLHRPDSNAGTVYRSTDLGTSWTPVTGLSVNNARPVADPVNPAKFYVYDPTSGKLMASTDGGASFSLKSQQAGGASNLLRATPGLEGDLWLCSESSGLSHSTDSGATFTRVAAVGACKAVGLGKAAPNATFPTLYMWGSVGTDRGMLRSIDKGVTWDRVNDDAHQYGGPLGAWVVGDMNTYGTVYMSTNGRGAAYGKIDANGDVPVVRQVPVVAPKPATCTYEMPNKWWGGGIATVTITNTSSNVIHGWNVSWTYADNSSVQGSWNGTVTGTSPTFTATDGGGWNHDIYPGGSAQVGMVIGGQDGPDPVSTPVVTGDICK